MALLSHVAKYAPSFLTLFFTKLIVKGEGETSVRSVEGSLSTSRRGSSSLDLSGDKIEEEMEHNPINIEKLIVSEEIIARNTTSVKIKVFYLVGGQAKLTPLKYLQVMVPTLREKGSQPL
jgi:hypothetical protein